MQNYGHKNFQTAVPNMMTRKCCVTWMERGWREKKKKVGSVDSPHCLECVPVCARRGDTRRATSPRNLHKNAAAW